MLWHFNCASFLSFTFSGYAARFENDLSASFQDLRRRRIAGVDVQLQQVSGRLLPLCEQKQLIALTDA